MDMQKLMSINVNWEDECDEVEGLENREIGTWMVADERSMGERRLWKPGGYPVNNPWRLNGGWKRAVH